MPLKGLKFARRKSGDDAVTSAHKENSSPAESSFRILDRTEAAHRLANHNKPTAHPRPCSTLPDPPKNDVLLDDKPTGRNDLYNHRRSLASALEVRSRISLDATRQGNPGRESPFPRQFPNNSEEPESPPYQEAKPRTPFASSFGNRLFPSLPKLKASVSSLPGNSNELSAPRGRSVTPSSYRNGVRAAHISVDDNGSIFEGCGSEGDTSLDRGSFRREDFQLPQPPPLARTTSDTLLAAKKQFSWNEQVEKPAPLSNRLNKSPSPERCVRSSWEHNPPQHAFSECGYNRQSQHYAEEESRQTDLALHRSAHSSQNSLSLAPDNEESLLAAVWAGQELRRRYGNSPSSHRKLPSRALANVQVSEQSLAAPHVSQHSSNEFAHSLRTTTTTDQLRTPVRRSMLPNTNRMMTSAEFERYKQSVADNQCVSRSQKSEDSEDYEDDEEDDAERARQLAKQRLKQEAHLAVYRQQMMKVTGEQPADALNRPSMARASQSMPSLGSASRLDPRNETLDGIFSDDSDEDIPLAVLQAHGFPSKSRPPSRLMSTTTVPQSRPTSQLSSYPPPSGSSKNEAAAGGGGNPALPVFARNLPKDPYVGASLVNVSDRHSVQYPPGGLVGVIAGEERARAMRRGSPNANGLYGGQPSRPYSMMAPQMPHHGMPPTALGMPFTPLGRPLTPTEVSQIEMNQSMTQMMQMQCQLMSQVMKTKSDSETPPSRPESMQSNRNERLSSPTSHGYFGNRSATPTSYTPSIAPSERSNIGQPSRYRPVTPNPLKPIHDSRANSMAFGRAPHSYSRQRSRSPQKLDLPSEGLGAVPLSSTIKAINKPKSSHGYGTGEAADEEEEDEKGWADLKMKREARKLRYAQRKKEKENAKHSKGVPEGLYYEG